MNTHIGSKLTKNGTGNRSGLTDTQQMKKTYIRKYLKPLT